MYINFFKDNSMLELAYSCLSCSLFTADCEKCMYYLVDVQIQDFDLIVLISNHDQNLSNLMSYVADRRKKTSKTSLKKSRGPPTILNGRFNVKDFVDFFCQRSKIETKHSFVLIIWRSHKQLLCFNRFLMYDAPINLFFWAAFKCFAYHNHVM